MAPTPEDKDKQKRTYLLNRNDAQRLAEDKRISEARDRAEKDRRIAEERFGHHQEQTKEDTKKSLDLQRKLDIKAIQDEKRSQDEATLHEDMNIVYSPQHMLKPKPGQKLFPEPEQIKKFRASLEDPAVRASIHYDETSGKLTFSGPRGLEALEQYLDRNPDSKFALFCDRSNLKSNLLELQQRGLLNKLDAIEMDDRLIQGNNLKSQILKTINWPPRPTPNGRSGG